MKAKELCPICGGDLEETEVKEDIHFMRRFSVQHLHARAEGKNANKKREAVKCLNQNLLSPIA